MKFSKIFKYFIKIKNLYNFEKLYIYPIIKFFIIKIKMRNTLTTTEYYNTFKDLEPQSQA